MRLVIQILLMLCIPIVSIGQSNDSINFKLIISPTSGGEIGYLIEVSNTIIKVTCKKLKISRDSQIVLGEDSFMKERKLKRSETNKISRYIREVETIGDKYNLHNSGYDGWDYIFIINESQPIIIYGYLLNTAHSLHEAAKLIDFLKKISPVKIKLRTF